MRHRLIAIVALTCFWSGCAVHQVHKDHDQIRTTLLDLYTNQVMDNLVRTANRMPIIQIDYTQATGMVTITNSIGGSDSQAATSNIITRAAAASAALRSIVTTLTGTINSENSNQVTIAASPNIVNNEIYDAYLEYLTIPGSLMVSRDPPPPGEAHICKEYCGKYYWVPVFHRDLFFKLSLLTTSQRGKALKAPDEFFSAIATYVREDIRRGDTRRVTLKLDTNIPSDSGYVVIDGGADSADEDGDAKEKKDVPNDKKDSGDSKPAGKKKIKQFDIVDITTGNLVDRPTVITIVVNPDEVAIFKPSARIKVYLDHERPKRPTTDDLLNRVNFQLQQIQFNQVRP